MMTQEQMRELVLSLSRRERKDLRETIDVITDEDIKNERDKRLSRLATTIHELFGLEDYVRGKNKEHVVPRSVLAYIAYNRGFSQYSIARLLDVRHSSIVFYRQRMEAALELPRQYPEYVELYKKAINEFHEGTDRDPLAV